MAKKQPDTDSSGGRRLDPPGQVDNEHSQRPDIPPGQIGAVAAGTDDADNLVGGHKADVLRGGAGGDSLDGAKGDDTLDGGAGDDDLTGGEGADQLTGGDGADTFHVGDQDRILDFTHNEDVIDLGGLSIGEGELPKLMAADFASARAAANAQLAGDRFDAVAVQVGSDVIIFADVGHRDHADTAVVLVGRSLADVSYGDFG